MLVQWASAYIMRMLYLYPGIRTCLGCNGLVTQYTKQKIHYPLNKLVYDKFHLFQRLMQLLIVNLIKLNIL